MQLTLKTATLSEMEVLLALVRSYHAFENVASGDAANAAALEPLLDGSDYGRIWLLELGGQTIGYIAVCFGYSIEFGGRDAFVDEMFVLPEHRGKGMGKAALEQVQDIVRDFRVRALHLEVDRTNERAQRLYRALGFTMRERFFLMSKVL